MLESARIFHSRPSKLGNYFHLISMLSLCIKGSPLIIRTDSQPFTSCRTHTEALSVMFGIILNSFTARKSNNALRSVSVHQTDHPSYLRKPDNNAEQSVHGFVTMPLALAKEVIVNKRFCIRLVDILQFFIIQYFFQSGENTDVWLTKLGAVYMSNFIPG